MQLTILLHTGYTRVSHASEMFRNLLMQQGTCNPEFYGDLVYKFKKIIGNPNFSNLLKRIVNRFKRAGYSLDIMRQTACLVFNPIMVEDYAELFSCTAVVQASDAMTASM